MKITIFTGVNPINYEYFFYFIDNFRKMSSGKVDLNFKVLTGPARGQRNLVCSKNQIEKIASKNAEIIDGNHLPGHGESLNFLISRLENDENYTLISDIDVAMVKKNWDIDALNLMKDNDIIGHPFEGSAMFKVGKRPDNAMRPQKTPTTTWMLINNAKSQIWKQLDFTHSKDEEQPISNEDADLYGVPEGFYLAKDIGWRIPKFLKQHQLKYHSFTNINKNSNLTPIIFSDVPRDMPWGDGTHKSGWTCEEGMLNGEPFLVHQMLSQRWKFKCSNVSKTFYDTVDEYLARL